VGKSGCGRAVKERRERTAIKQLGSKLVEDSCSGQGEIINDFGQRYLCLNKRETLSLDQSMQSITKVNSFKTRENLNLTFIKLFINTTASPTSSYLFDLGSASKAAFVSTNDGPSTAQEFISNIHYYATPSCCAEEKKGKKESVVSQGNSYTWLVRAFD